MVNANIRRGADGYNPKASEIVAPATKTTADNKLDFLLKMVRKMHVKMYGEADTATVFENDENRSLTKGSKIEHPRRDGVPEVVRVIDEPDTVAVLENGETRILKGNKSRKPSRRTRVLVSDPSE